MEIIIVSYGLVRVREDNIDRVLSIVSHPIRILYFCWVPFPPFAQVTVWPLLPTKRLFKKKKERKYQFWTSVRKHRELRMAKKIQLITNLDIMRVSKSF